MTKDQLLELVERIATCHAAEMVDMDVANNRTVSTREKEMAEALGNIYRFTHSVNPHSCQMVHKNWIAEAEEAYKTLKDI